VHKFEFTKMLSNVFTYQSINISASDGVITNVRTYHGMYVVRVSVPACMYAYVYAYVYTCSHGNHHSNLSYKNRVSTSLTIECVNG